MISTQWFVRIQPLADAALEAVRDGRIQIVPERFTKVYYNWLENIQDWCISRQLWWGHRIPVWYCDDCGEMTVAREDPTQCAHCGSSSIEQDPDVLDTWFSSGLWPFSTLGWPEETPDFKYFYPTSVLETGYDILFFWVARMIMDGLEFTGKPPFHTVYLHGLIRDEHGQKMSKTKGNVIDPLVVMDEMGTDALRFTLLVGSTPGNDMNLSLKKGGSQPQLCQQDLECRALRDRRAGAGTGHASARAGLDPGQFVDLGAAAGAGAQSGPPVCRLPVRRSRTADLRILLERVRRLVPGDCQAAAGRGRRPGLLDGLHPGAGAGYLPAPAASLHPVCDRRTVGPPEAQPAWNIRWRSPRNRAGKRP